MANSAHDSGTNPFAKMREENADMMDVSTDVSTDAMLNGERASHFPEKRNRRQGDRDQEVITRLFSALDAIERGEIYTGEEEEDSPLIEDFYRQF